MIRERMGSGGGEGGGKDIKDGLFVRADCSE